MLFETPKPFLVFNTDLTFKDYCVKMMLKRVLSIVITEIRHIFAPVVGNSAATDLINNISIMEIVFLIVVGIVVMFADEYCNNKDFRKKVEDFCKEED